MPSRQDRSSYPAEEVILGTVGPKRRDKNFIYGVWGTLFALVLGAGVVAGARPLHSAYKDGRCTQIKWIEITKRKEED
jgi:hypothetical protein